MLAGARQCAGQAGCDAVGNAPSIAAHDPEHTHHQQKRTVGAQCPGLPVEGTAGNRHHRGAAAPLPHCSRRKHVPGRCRQTVLGRGSPDRVCTWRGRFAKMKSRLSQAPLATMRPVRSLSGRRSQGTPCVSPRAPPTREMRCSSRPSYRRASRGFWVPSGLGFRCSWCLVCTVPSAFRFATRLPTLSMIKPAHNHQRGCLLCTRRAEVEPTLYFLALYLFLYPTYAAHELPQGHQGQVPVTPTKSECKSVLVDNSSGFLTIIERRRAFNQGS